MENALYHYELLPNNVHQLTLLATTPDTVDAWMDWQTEIIKQTTPNQKVRLLIRQTGMLPLNYTMQKAREFNAAHPERPVFITAFLHPPDVMVSLVTSMINAFTSRMSDRVKFFPQDQREAALKWLLQS